MTGMPRVPELGPRDLFALISDHKLAAGAGILLSVAAGLATLAQPLIVNQLMENVSGGRAPGALPALLIAALLLGALLTSAREYVLLRAGESVVRGSRVALIRRVLKLPIAQYDRRRVGDLVSRVSADTAELRNVLTHGFVDAIGGIVVLVGSLIAMCALDAPLFFVALALAGFAIGSVMLISARARVIAAEAQTFVGAMADRLTRALQAIRTVRAANASDREAEKIEQEANAAWSAGVSIARNEAIIAPVAMIASQVSLLAILGVGGLRVSTGEITIATLITFMLFLVMMMSPLGSVFNMLSSMNRSLGALSRIRAVASITIEQDCSGTERFEGKEPVDPELSVVFDQVSFSYPNESDSGGGEAHTSALIRNVSFTVAPNSRTAIVGPSGAGKSTLFALLERFYDPDSGGVFVGGIDVSQVPRADTRALLAYVEQGTPVLAGTVRENLLLAHPAGSDDECCSALKQVNLGSYATASGLDAEVGENGQLLSGGERQRLVIARALLTPAPILLLDESTSHLDAENEALLAAAIDDAGRGRTVLTIAHRLSTVVDADQIVVMDAGEVVGIGTHPELLQTCPLYADLASRQFLAAA